MLFSVLTRKKWFQTPVSFSLDTSGKWYDLWNCAQRVIKKLSVKSKLDKVNEVVVVKSGKVVSVCSGGWVLFVRLLGFF